MNRFRDALLAAGLGIPVPSSIGVVQVNLGPRCNLSCAHCHVEGGPGRLESMPCEVLDRVIGICVSVRPRIVDLTGGAPELHPLFRETIDALCAAGLFVQVRSNLVVLNDRRFADLPSFLAARGVAVAGSLPSANRAAVDGQRGPGSFDSAVRALKSLNEAGYGTEGGPEVILVHNPAGPALPPERQGLEAAVRKALRRAGVAFNRLETMNNMPVGRFGQSLAAAGELDQYLEMLESAFSPEAALRLDCLRQVSIRWDGTLFDCDFNIALGRPANCPGNTVDSFDAPEFLSREIRFDDHCLGCTAGAGNT